MIRAMAADPIKPKPPLKNKAFAGNRAWIARMQRTAGPKSTIMIRTIALRMRIT